MALEEYKKKRKFGDTPEPEGSVFKNNNDSRFVIQKHKASRLHYDLRFETGGVLKSWAVPKGPSLDPEDKRLAIQVEDHPVDYINFEGTIPKGNYGAGEVIVWDRGTYALKDGKNFSLGLNKGHLSFDLNGQKLKGGFDLVKLASDEKSWLLIKKKDEFTEKKGITRNERSVISGRDINFDGNTFWVKLNEAIRAPYPKKIKPMLATLAADPFDGEGWIFEIKWDGYRVMAYLRKKSVELLSRNDLVLSKKFNLIAEKLEMLGIEAVLDGEVVVLDDKGKPNFQLMQNYNEEKGGILVYYIFDIVYLDGRDLTGMPLMKRKALLEQVIREDQNIKISKHIESSGKDFFHAITNIGLEGIIAKKANSLYLTGNPADRLEEARAALEPPE